MSSVIRFLFAKQFSSVLPPIVNQQKEQPQGCSFLLVQQLNQKRMFGPIATRRLLWAPWLK